MEILNRQASLEAFLLMLRKARESILMLDYDGTLAPFVTERMKAVPYPGIRERLEALAANPRTRLVIVSGRQVSDLKHLLGLELWPEIWGCHGAERLTPAGVTQLTELPGNVRDALWQVEEWSKGRNLQNQTEIKPASVAFHWRGLPEDEAQELEDKVRSRWQKNEAGDALELHVFDGGLELRAAGISKGDAVAKILSESSAEAPAAFLGDDRTDEDAFEQLAGLGLSVLVRPDFRPTIADIWLQPPEELLSFLDHWLKAVGD